MENFICDTSKICWELYEKTHQLGFLMLHLKLEYSSEKELIKYSMDNSYSNDGGMEL